MNKHQKAVCKVALVICALSLLIAMHMTAPILIGAFYIMAFCCIAVVFALPLCAVAGDSGEGDEG